MPSQALIHRPSHARSAAERERDHDRRRPSFRQRGYDARWAKARAAFLRQHSWCVMCMRAGQPLRATVVDHIAPHRGDPKLFWAEANWQPLCKPHHDRDKQREERGSAREDVRAMFPLPTLGSDT